MRVCKRSRRKARSFASQRSSFQCFIIRMKRFLILHVFGALLVTMAQGATSFELAAKATNELGVDSPAARDRRRKPLHLALLNR